VQPANEKGNKIALRRQMGGRLRTLRQEIGMNVDELAMQLDITPSFLGLIERGDRGMSAERLIDICEFFKCSADFILTGADRISPEIPIGTSNLAKSIDLLLSEHSKEKLADFIKTVKPID
jgi:transcriptional regulator with XRE-family HTH domain